MKQHSVAVETIRYELNHHQNENILFPNIYVWMRKPKTTTPPKKEMNTSWRENVQSKYLPRNRFSSIWFEIGLVTVISHQRPIYEFELSNHHKMYGNMFFGRVHKHCLRLFMTNVNNSLEWNRNIFCIRVLQLLKFWAIFGYMLQYLCLLKEICSIVFIHTLSVAVLRSEQTKVNCHMFIV